MSQVLMWEVIRSSVAAFLCCKDFIIIIIILEDSYLS